MRFIAVLRLDPFWATYEVVEKPFVAGYVDVFKGMLTTMRYFKMMESLDAC